MRIKKQRATHKICKDCVFKVGVKCAYMFPPIVSIYKEKGRTIDSDCDSKISIGWDEDYHPEEYKMDKKNWQKLHRKEHMARIVEGIREEIEFKIWHKNFFGEREG